jgi:hypothetical protein
MILLEELPIFLQNDQPMTCPTCGTRTLLVADFFHTSYKGGIHWCGNDDYWMVEQEEEGGDF